ncbi:shikimate dehydrogenase [Candidatus Poriferisodalis sp.]|uniref:shikimate dehydrogenase n=1 Tax=Candidatus Poriferisodalis sp. TaxID=3101277 RepID=UPI003D09B323
MSDEQAHQRPSGRTELMLRPSGRTKVAGVIGDPVQHSLSPALHNAAFEHLGLDWVYTAFGVPAGQGADAVAAMRVLGIEGLSVTMPHKDDVAAACDELSFAAALLGAVNCVCRDGGRLIGENTDGAGFVNSLQAQAGMSPAGLDALVLGAGGAGRAVIAALAAGGASVTVANRSPAAAERAAAIGTSAAGGGGAVVVGTAAAAGSADLVVNATSLGMSAGDPLPLEASLLTEGQVVVDLIYQPERTPLLEAATAAGATTLNGVGMLLFQAAEQFRMWTGHEAPVDVMASAVGLQLAG